MAFTTKPNPKSVGRDSTTLALILLTVLIHEVIGIDRDVTPPHVSGCPDNTTISAQAPVGQWKTTVGWDEPTATDETEITVQQSHRPDMSYFYVGSTYVTYFFIDGQFNVATCQFTVNVTSESYAAYDITPPILRCPPQKMAVVNSESSSTIVVYSAEASDNSGGDVYLYYYPPSGSAFSPGVRKVWVYASDQNYNQAYCSFDVVVIAGCRHPGNLQNGAVFPFRSDIYPIDSKVIFNCRDGYELIGVTEILCTDQKTWSADLPQCVETNRPSGGMCGFSIGDILGAVIGTIIGILALEIMIYIVYNRYRNSRHEKSNNNKQNQLTTPVSRNRYYTNPVTSPQQATNVPTTNDQPAKTRGDVKDTSSGYQSLDPDTRDLEHNYTSVKSVNNNRGSEVTMVTGDTNGTQQDDNGYMKPMNNDDDGYIEIIP